MPQLHFSVDETTAQRLRDQAEREGVSLSRYLAKVLGREVQSEWPQGYLAAVVGSCAGDPIEEPTELDLDDVEL